MYLRLRLTQAILGARSHCHAAFDGVELTCRGALIGVALLWLLALPYDGLWKHTYVDEHAIQPAQVSSHATRVWSSGSTGIVSSNSSVGDDVFRLVECSSSGSISRASGSPHIAQRHNPRVRYISIPPLTRLIPMTFTWHWRRRAQGDTNGCR